MYLLGTILIISGIAAAMLASVSYALVPNGRTARWRMVASARARRWARCCWWSG